MTVSSACDKFSPLSIATFPEFAFDSRLPRFVYLLRPILAEQKCLQDRLGRGEAGGESGAPHLGDLL